jgi:hypothetical protein
MAQILAPGARFDGHYVIESVAGRGGMGVVYRAHDEELDRAVALKVAAPGLADLPHLQDGLRREARLAARVEHPAVVAVHHVGVVDGRPYVALQWVDGTDLLTRLVLGPPPLPEGLEILEQLAAGLDAAHRAGCLHRDVKPANVLVRETPTGPRAALTDFGVAGALQDAGSHAAPAAAAELVGTPAYLAPELVQGAAGDERSDLYGLACVAFEVLTGTPPFTAASVPAMLVAHAVRPRPAASKRRAALPVAVDAVLERGMAIDPAHRPASGSELVAELHTALGLAAGGRPAPGSRARLRRLRAVLDARPRLRRAAAATALVTAALLAAGAGAAGHELTSEEPLTREGPALRATRPPPKPRLRFFGGDKPAPVGREAREEVAALFADYAALNRTQSMRTFLRIGGPSSAQLYGRDFRCRRGDDSLPPGLVLPKESGLSGKTMAAVQRWAWRTRRAPVRFEGLTPASLQPLPLPGGPEALQWRGRYRDGAGRVREMRLVATHDAPRYAWTILFYDFCPDIPVT